MNGNEASFFLLGNICQRKLILKDFQVESNHSQTDYLRSW